MRATKILVPATTGHASHTHARHKQLQAGADVSQQKYECPFTQLLTLVFLCNLLGLEIKQTNKKKTCEVALVHSPLLGEGGWVCSSKCCAALADE